MTLFFNVSLCQELPRNKFDFTSNSHMIYKRDARKETSGLEAALQSSIHALMCPYTEAHTVKLQ
jgi:hypothetical protein